MNRFVVGQDVWIRSGPCFQKGKVAEITEKYILVEIPRPKNAVRSFIRFDATTGKTGTGWDGLGYFEYVGDEVGMLQSDPRLPGTVFGPWKLTDEQEQEKQSKPYKRIVDAAFLLAVIVCLVIGFWRLS